MRVFKSFVFSLGRAFVALALVLVLNFLLLHLPSQKVVLNLAGNSELEQESLKKHVAALERRYGLDRPFFEQFIDFASNMACLDFGRSMTTPRTVGDRIEGAWKNTIALQGAALFLTFGLGIPLGVWLARRVRRQRERIIRGGLYALAAIPEFWLATLLFMGFATTSLFPIEGLTSSSHDNASWFPAFIDRLHHMVLPVAALTLPAIGLVARQTRNAMIEALESEEIQSLRARGLPETRIVWRYAMRSAALPAATLFGAALPSLVGGSIVVERVFNIRGLGMLLWEATFERDYPVLQALLFLGAVFVVVGYALSNALVAWLDPRARA